LDGVKKEKMQPEEKIRIKKPSNWSRFPVTIPVDYAFELNRLIKKSGISKAEFCRNAFILGVRLYAKQLGLENFRERELPKGENDDLS
jgi:hypothetical protein